MTTELDIPERILIFMTGPSGSCPNNLVREEIILQKKNWESKGRTISIITWDYRGTNKFIKKVCGKNQIPVEVMPAGRSCADAPTFRIYNGAMVAMKKCTYGIVFVEQMPRSITAMGCMMQLYTMNKLRKIVTFSVLRDTNYMKLREKII